MTCVLVPPRDQPEERVLVLLKLESQLVVQPECWGTNWGPLREQCVLLTTEPSLQSPKVEVQCCKMKKHLRWVEQCCAHTKHCGVHPHHHCTTHLT